MPSASEIRAVAKHFFETGDIAAVRDGYPPASVIWHNTDDAEQSR